ncbi:MAG: PA14 domain-containing protein, partial [Planctomycetota bacterium]|nr:PA14 domain-containing protein [Planctomycetota bacterium]
MKSPRLLVFAILLAPVPCQEDAHEHAPGVAAIPVIDREWRSRTDEAFPGELVGVQGGHAELLRADGRRTRIPIAVFCDADRAVIEKWWKRNSPPAGFGDPDVTIVITTLRAQMKYDKVRIEVPPKAKVRLILRNLDDMPHNLIICRPPADDKGLEVAQAAWKLEGDGFAKEWVPKHARVMHASGMVYAKESHSLWFKAPAKGGLYPYVCTFPGHAMMMNGVMVVSDRRSGLVDLRYRLFRGQWNKLPDFSKLEPIAEGVMADNLLSLDPKKKGDEFGLVFNGTLHAPVGGEYEFKLASDDGSSLHIDGKRMLDNDGVHGKKTVSGRVSLTAGRHSL